MRKRKIERPLDLYNILASVTPAQHQSIVLPMATIAQISHPDSPPETPEQINKLDTHQAEKKLSQEIETSLPSDDGSSTRVVTPSPDTADCGMEPIQSPTRSPGRRNAQDQVQVPSTPRPGLQSKLERTPSQTQRKLAFPRTQSSNHVMKNVSKLESSQLRQSVSPRQISQARKTAKVGEQTQQEPESAQRDGRNDSSDAEEEEIAELEKETEAFEDTVELEEFNYQEIERQYREELEAVHKQEQIYFNDMESYGRVSLHLFYNCDVANM
jgi:hypothetical protein